MAKYAIVVCNDKNEPVEYLGLSNREEIKLTNEQGEIIGTLGNYEVPDDELAMKIFNAQVKKIPMRNDLIRYKLCKGEKELAEIWK